MSFSFYGGEWLAKLAVVRSSFSSTPIPEFPRTASWMLLLRCSKVPTSPSCMSIPPTIADNSQHASGVMQVANHFFENAMTFFTSMLQISISFTVANGDGTSFCHLLNEVDVLVAPFVGHNAFLRWSALQECAQVDKEDGISRVWSESHVSEDFQIALNLQSNGWMLRWATYSNMQFEEGVSLSAIDELARWEKYSYGCSYVYSFLVHERRDADE